MGDRLQVGFLTIHDPLNRKSFSGTPYFMYRALQASSEVDVRMIGPRRRLPGRISRLLKRGGRGMVGTPRSQRADGVTIDDVDETRLDWIVSLASLSLLDRLAPELRTPVINITDATPQFTREVYGLDIDAEVDRMEPRVIAATERTIFSSHYMAERAVKEYGLTDTSKLSVIPFGLNLEEIPERLEPKPPFEPLRLLHIGKHWKYKGGDTAIEALKALRSRGVKARLSLVGDVADEARGVPGVEVVGYLDKSKPADYRRFVQLLRESHVFILPTRADCTPMVVAEANSYGLPVVISDIGGIASLMAPGANGAMLPAQADGAAYADRIMEMTADPATYAALSRSSFEHCHRRLTWEAWTRDLVALMRARVAERAAAE